MSDESDLAGDIKRLLQRELAEIAGDNGLDTFENTLDFRYAVGCFFVAVVSLLVIAGLSDLLGKMKPAFYLVTLIEAAVGAYYLDRSTAAGRRRRRELKAASRPAPVVRRLK